MRLRTHVIVLVVFLGLVAWYTWPLLRHPTYFPVERPILLNLVIMLAIFWNLVTQPAHLLEAVRDEGSARLSPEAVGALGALGVRGDLRGRYRAAHAFVGVKGALRGAAVEALDSRPVTLVVGQRPRAEIGVEVVDFELRRI